MFQNEISKLFAVSILVTALHLYADSSTLPPQQIAKQLHLIPASKAMMQWERVFKSKRKLKRYKIDTLNEEQQMQLKEYLIDHAIDSDQPTVAGV